MLKHVIQSIPLRPIVGIVLEVAEPSIVLLSVDILVRLRHFCGGHDETFAENP